MRIANDFLTRLPLLALQSSTLNLPSSAKICEDELFMEAIYFASPDFYLQLIKYLQKTTQFTFDEKIRTSLLKYYLRAQSRCTPFGLFATCQIGIFGTGNNLEVSTDLIKHTKLDTNFVVDFVHSFRFKREVIRDLIYFANNSIYIKGDKIRYIELLQDEDKLKAQLSTIDLNEILVEILKQSKGGKAFKELYNMLVAHNIDSKIAEDYLFNLIDNQILIDELQYSVTGLPYAESLSNKLQSLACSTRNVFLERASILFNSIVSKIKESNANSSENISNHEVAFQLANQELRYNKKGKFLQTNAYRSGKQLTLDSGIKNRIEDAFHLLKKLHIKDHNVRFEIFKERFFRRFEYQMVKLIDVLDSEDGLGYDFDSPSDKDDIFNIVAAKIHRSTQNNSEHIEKILFNKYIYAHKNDLKYVEVFESELEEIKTADLKLPPTMGFVYRLIDGQNLLQFDTCYGPSAVNLISRFATDHEGCLELARSICEFEDLYHSDKILASIVHLPEARLGNVVSRPLIRKFEIPYLTAYNTQSEFVIDAEDLYLQFNDNRLVLFSKSRGKTVVPCIDTAHNYVMANVPFYRFLCDLQNEEYNLTSLNFSWSRVHEHTDFLPGVLYKGVVISPAKWVVRKREFINNPDIETWRKSRKISDQVTIVEGDNEMLIDFTSPESVAIFKQYQKKGDQILLSDFLFKESGLIARDKHQNGYVNQFISVIYNDANNRRIEQKHDIPAISETQRVFYPGDIWIYYKFYLGTKTSDMFLRDCIQPLMQKLEAECKIEKWFFIRYGDPDYHLRIRLLCKDAVDEIDVTNKIQKACEPFYKKSLIAKVQRDTYVRELERYKPELIEISESLFYYNSLEVINVLNASIHDLDFNAISSIHFYFEAMALPISERVNFLDFIEGSAIDNLGKRVKIKWDLNYRERVLNFRQYVNNENIRLTKLSDKYYVNIRNEFTFIKESKILLDGTSDFFNFLGSHIHMNLNRLYAIKQNEKEREAYYFLLKFYRSEIAKSKKKINFIL